MLLLLLRMQQVYLLQAQCVQLLLCALAQECSAVRQRQWKQHP
jgi:hypothetical protein